MENLLKTINVLFESNAISIGLDSVDQMKFGPYEDLEGLPVKSVSVFQLRTLPDEYRFKEHDREKYLTIMQVDVITKSSDDFAPVRIRDTVFALLDNRRMLRQDWIDPDNPIDAGEIKFKYRDEDPFDLGGNVKAISLTYEVEWWKPRG